MDKSSYEVRIQQWIKIIQEASASGLSKRDWCSQNGIPIRKFYYWHKKAREYMLARQPEKSGSSSGNSTQISVPATPVFYEVKESSETAKSFSKLPVGQAESFLPEAVIRYEDFGIFVGSSISEKTLSTILSVIRNA